ncbi:MAG: flagellar export protein FliJ [Pirellulaceae bacterium]
MARFRFRLETVLKLRRGERDERRHQLAEALEAEQILAEHERELNDETDQVRQQLRSSSKPGEVHVDDLMNVHRYELVLRARRIQIEQQKVKIAAEVQRRRQALTEADKRVRTLEKLEEKQRLAHRHDQAQLEVKQLDETAQQRAALRVREAR